MKTDVKKVSVTIIEAKFFTKVNTDMKWIYRKLITIFLLSSYLAPLSPSPSFVSIQMQATQREARMDGEHSVTAVMTGGGGGGQRWAKKDDSKKKLPLFQWYIFFYYKNRLNKSVISLFGCMFIGIRFLKCKGIFFNNCFCYFTSKIST